MTLCLAIHHYIRGGSHPSHQRLPPPLLPLGHELLVQLLQLTQHVSLHLVSNKEFYVI